MYEYSNRKDGSPVYPGYYLDYVITPIYDVIAYSFKIKGVDSENRKNYDDYNQFFWSKECLKYKIFDDDDENDINIEQGQLKKSHQLINKCIHISAALKLASKSYIERRSWFHVLYNMHRIVEWHMISFMLLLIYGFSCRLQWSNSYTIQVGSCIFVFIILMSILWICLELWTIFPSTNMTVYTKYGYILRLASAYIVLIYQTIYLNKSFIASEGKVATYYWIQYFYISVFS